MMRTFLENSRPASRHRIFEMPVLPHQNQSVAFVNYRCKSQNHLYGGGCGHFEQFPANCVNRAIGGNDAAGLGFAGFQPFIVTPV